MDPTTLMLAASAAQGLGAAMAPAPSGASGGSDGWGMFDNSGWTVATGSATADGAIVGDKGGGERYGNGVAGAAALGGQLSGLLPWLIGGFVVVAVAKAWRRK